MQKSIGIVCVFICWAWAASAEAAEGVVQECVQRTENRPYAYCINRVPGSQSKRLIYHLHGRDLHERIWADPVYYTGMVQQEWRERGIDFPTVVTVSFGPLWMFSSSGRTSGGARQIFIEQVIPEVERQLNVTNPQRVLLGESMGGFNALQLLNEKNVLFTKLASLCPPIYDITYPLSLSQLKSLADRTGMEYRVAFALWRIHRKFIRNREDWEDLALLEKANRLVPGETPALYLSCGLIDQYGNYEGAEKFYQIARSRNINVEWHPLYARHCGVDIQSLADFLTA